MKIGFICPEFIGHLNPMTALGRELAGRGHEITVLARPDAQAMVLGAGLGFHPLGQSEFSSDGLARQRAKLGELSATAALRHTIEMLRLSAKVLLRDAPQAVRALGLDALVVDQVTPAGGTVADELGLPHVQVCNALALNPDPWLPPATLPWRFQRGFFLRIANRIANLAGLILASRIGSIEQDYRRRLGLPIKRYPDQMTYLAEITQQPAFFDFPRSCPPPRFHYTGPWHSLGDSRGTDFPWQKLDGRPLVYASLGTLQTRLEHFFEIIAEAVAGLDAQLVISLGDSQRETAALASQCKGHPLIVSAAPQLELLKIASVGITHAGLNTVLESLAQGVPMVAIPITNDQPGVARRLEWLGAGHVITPARVTPARLRKLIESTMGESPVRQKARWCRERIASVDGLKSAGDLVETAFSTAKPPRGFPK